MSFVHVYGERNSGTSHLSKLLQDNMREPDKFLGMARSETTPYGTELFGYKHWFPDLEKLSDIRQENTLFIVVYRNPYTWVKAMMDRPYALEQSIGGLDVGALPGVTLKGHINGKDTRNEFHPDTGKGIDLFELRALKIERFEALKSLVGNVAYLNIEALLDNPKAVIDGLADAYEATFVPAPVVDRQPPRKLVEECDQLMPFTQAELSVLNRNINWTMEKDAGYQRVSPVAETAGRQRKMYILHGASTVGKTTMMRELVAQKPEFIGVELDDCHYWEDYAPKFGVEQIAQVCPNVGAEDSDALLELYQAATIEGQRTIAYLFERLPELIGQMDQGHPVIMTCGGLPRIRPPGIQSIYHWLSEHLGISFNHIMIELPEHVHIERMKARGRLHLKSAILENNRKRQVKRSLHDAVISGYDELLAALYDSAVCGLTSEKKARLVRVHENTQNPLRYIQLYGERNSGTNYLKRLLTVHMRVPENFVGSYATKSNPVSSAKLMGYKHFYVNPEKVAKHQSRTLFLVIYKNPYTWLRSMMEKPYHFRASLEGKVLTDLPDIKLDGRDSRGTKIKDVHPETGADVTMFELRAHKIANWEGLVDQVDNVAFVNYEHLLMYPTQIVQTIVARFGSLFHTQHIPHILTDKRYLDKYVTPEPFADGEMDAMDAHINWDAEARVGYAKGNLFIPD